MRLLHTKPIDELRSESHVTKEGVFQMKIDLTWAFSARSFESVNYQFTVFRVCL